MSKKSFELGRELARVMQKEAGLGETIGRGVDSAVGYGANAIGTGARTVAGFSAPGMMLSAPGRITGAVNTAAQAGRSLGSGIARMGFGAHNAAQGYLRSATQPQPARTPAPVAAPKPMGQPGMVAAKAPTRAAAPSTAPQYVVTQTPPAPSPSSAGRPGMMAAKALSPAPQAAPAARLAAPMPAGWDTIPQQLRDRYQANVTAGRTKMSPAEALGYYTANYGNAAPAPGVLPTNQMARLPRTPSASPGAMPGGVAATAQGHGQLAPSLASRMSQRPMTPGSMPPDMATQQPSRSQAGTQVRHQTYSIPPEAMQRYYANKDAGRTNMSREQAIRYYGNNYATPSR